MQGPDTDRKAVDEIRQAVQREDETTVRVLNYRKNGEPFWNMFTIAPMADAGGKNRFFIGIQAGHSHRICLKQDDTYGGSALRHCVTCTEAVLATRGCSTAKRHCIPLHKMILMERAALSNCMTQWC